MAINVGQRLNELLKQKHITQLELNRRIGRNGAAYHIIRQPSVQVHLLWDICIAVEHDLFADISNDLQTRFPQTTTAANQNNKTTIANLQHENEQLRTERDYLKKMIDLLEVVKK